MTDQDVRDLLERMAAEEPVPFFDAASLTRRARYRAVRTVLVGAVGVVAAIAVLIAGVAEIRTDPLPADQPTPAPVTEPPPPFTERFDSPLNGLSIGYPSSWRTRAASEPWEHGAIDFDAPDVDVIFDPTIKDDLYLAVVSEPLGDTSPHHWVYDMWGNLESVGICTRAVGSGGGGGTPFRGHYAWFEHCGTHVGTDDLLIVATATRGYIINLHVANDRLLQATYGHETDWFEAALKTVDLRPEDALDARSPSESP